MTTTTASPTSATGRTRTWNPHRHLARYLAGPPPAADEVVALRGPWVATYDLLVQGTACGAGIGFVVGGAIGVWYYVIGAVYVAPLGAIAGAVIGLPASLVLAFVLPDTPSAPELVRRRTATTLALLLEAIVAWLLVWAFLSDTGEDRRERMLVAVPAILVYGALVAWLLRRSSRRLADRWNERCGWKAVRS